MRALKTIQRVEATAEQLKNVLTDDRRFLVKDFNRLKNDSDVVKVLAGKGKFSDWASFKEAFQSQQEKLGFEWIAQQGRGGPLYLDSIVIPALCGTELARQLFDEETREGDFSSLLVSQFPTLYQLAGTGIEVDTSQARDAFKSTEKDNRSFRFRPGRGSSFTLSIQEYCYPGGKKAEFNLGEAITDKLRHLLDLDLLVHVQHGRGGGKYRNVDLEGFRVHRSMDGDEFLYYNFELKSSNGIHAISQAISQAVNYQPEAHFTCIVIPCFDPGSFHDPDRLNDLLGVCRANNLGVLSVEVDTDSSSGVINDVLEVVAAPRTPIEMPEPLTRLVQQSDLEKCPLCRKIVNIKQDRPHCGWPVVDKDTQDRKCMKVELEKMAVNSAPDSEG